MKKLNFELIIASPYDRERLVVEINYENDIPVFIEQENLFFEAIFYHGEPESIMLPLDDFITILQDAKVLLAGNENEYRKLYNANRELFESTKETYIKHCKLITVPPIEEEKEKIVEILYNEQLIVKLHRENGYSNVDFYYHRKNIIIPVEALQYLLCEARKLMIN